MRIISLLPSSSEIVCGLGFQEHLVGRSHECDFPEAVTHLPICTAPKFNPDGSSYEINQRVQAILQEALSVYRVDAEQLDALAPDLLITQSHCEVCAVSLKEVEAAACQLIHSAPAIVALSPNYLQDVWQDIQTVADALNVSERGERFRRSLNQRLEDIRQQTRQIQPRPTVVCIEWISPLMTAGNWVPELIEMAAGIPLLSKAGQHSPWIDWDALLQADPDKIIIMPCGFAIPKIREALPALTTHPAWSELKAVQQQQVYLSDGNQYFNRPGPRLVESLEILCEILHPAYFSGRYNGSAWEHAG